MSLSRLAEKILDELVHASPMTSNRLHELGGKSATRRLSELREAGYDIQRDVYSGDYRLVSKPLPVIEWQTFTCECGFSALEPAWIHTTMFGMVCPKCGKGVAA